MTAIAKFVMAVLAVDKSTALQEIHAFLAAMGTKYPPMKRPAVLILQQKLL